MRELTQVFSTAVTFKRWSYQIAALNRACLVTFLNKAFSYKIHRNVE